MHDFVNAFLLCYATLFPIVSPVGNMPLFLSLTQDASERERAALAGKTALYSFFMLLGSLLVGSYVLEFFGISLPILRIGGGMVVTALGWRLLHPGPGSAKDQPYPTAGGEPPDAFYPITMPLTVGPGAIAATIALGSQRPHDAGASELLMLGGAAVAGLLGIAATIYLCYRFAEGTVARLGPNGVNVVVRLAAFILLCIGLQIVWNGASALLATL